MFGVSSSEGTQQAYKICGECGKTDEKLLRCGKCKSEWYCDVTCQKKAWPKHKQVCQVQVKTEKPILMGAAPFLNSGFLSQYPEFFGISSTPLQTPRLTEDQMEDALKLVAINPLDSILDQGETEAYVKKLGQEFFDKYKEKAGGDSTAGKLAVRNICNWVAFNKTDSPANAKLRKQYIEYAWDGIGDENWHWMH